MGSRNSIDKAYNYTGKPGWVWFFYLVIPLVIPFTIIILLSFPNTVKGLYQGNTPNQGMLWPSGEVPVCFRNPGDCPWPPNPNSCRNTTNKWEYQIIESYPDEWKQNRQIVKDAIEATWSKWSNLHFTDWGDCPDDLTGYIYIDLLHHNQDVWWYRLDPNKPTELSQLGQQGSGDSYPHGYRREGTRIWLSTKADGLINPGTAIHEFGHALGFIHELARPDARPGGVCICLEYSDDCKHEDGNCLTPYYDPFSIMNYCAPKHHRLSVGDIEGVQEVYGTSINEIWRQALPGLMLYAL